MIPVVTFYTPEYKQEACELEKTCKLFNISCRLYPKSSKGSWVKNCAFKSYYIYEMLMTLKTDVLWLDSDSCIMKYPSLFDTIKEDFAIRAEPGQRTKKPIGREPIHLPQNWPQSIAPCWFNT